MRMNRAGGSVMFTALLIGALLGGCERNPSPPPSVEGQDPKPPAPTSLTLAVGYVGKSQSNAVFQVGLRGAQDAARQLPEEHRLGVEYRIDLKNETPPDEDAQKQAEAIERLSTLGADGILVSCSDAAMLTGAINKAVERGTIIICFDSDAPDSNRHGFFGTDDLDCGRQVMAELAKVMGQRGTIAILAGNQTAPNLQKRKEGVLQELARHPDMKLLENGVFYHEETPEKAVQALVQAQTTHPTIEGWALIGGWPLFTKNALPWPAGQVKIVSVDALPEMIDYLDSGHVQVLLAQDCYGWGYETMRMFLELIRSGGESLAHQRVTPPLTRVTKDNAAEYREKFKQWIAQ